MTNRLHPNPSALTGSGTWNGSARMVSRLNKIIASSASKGNKVRTGISNLHVTNYLQKSLFSIENIGIRVDTQYLLYKDVETATRLSTTCSL